MKKYLAVGVFLAFAAGMSAPGFAYVKRMPSTAFEVAQAISPSYGTGNPVPYSFDASGHAHQVVTPSSR